MFPTDKDIQYIRNRTLVNPDLREPLCDSPPIVRFIHDSLKGFKSNGKLLIPNLYYEDTIMCFSDFGGYHNKSNYITWSFLFTGMENTYFFMEKVNELRKRYNLYTSKGLPKEISFKDFNYGPIKRILPEYLKLSSDILNGFLYTLVIEKNIPSLSGKFDQSSKLKIFGDLNSLKIDSWKERPLVKLINVMHIIGYIHSLLQNKEQNFFWMCDNDEILSNDDQKSHIDIFFNFIYRYARYKIPKIGFATAFEKEQNNIFYADILSLCDIFCGCLEEYMTKRHNDPDILIKDESQDPLLMMCGQGLMLKRYATLIKKDGESAKLSNLEFQARDKDYLNNLRVIYL